MLHRPKESLFNKEQITQSPSVLQDGKMEAGSCGEEMALVNRVVESLQEFEEAVPQANVKVECGDHVMHELKDAGCDMTKILGFYCFNYPLELHEPLVEIAKDTPHHNVHILQHDTPLESLVNLWKLDDMEEDKSSCDSLDGTVRMGVPSSSSSSSDTSYSKRVLLRFVHGVDEGSWFSVSTLQTTGIDLLDSECILVQVSYRNKIGAFRGLGRILSAIFSAETGLNEALNFQEEMRLDTLGIMIDCSRCAVLRLSSVFYLLRKMALMGMNTLQLYTEDTYEVKDEPFFGFLRGGYTTDELKKIDDYAYAFGIEAFPCIQTLGHLGQILQWPRFSHLRDTSEIVLCGLEETYRLIEKMIDSISPCFRSSRIHIGMDEAHGMGEGRYKNYFGHREHTHIFMDHLKQVHHICLRKGLKPLIWSDMLFTLSANNHSLQSYYDQDGFASPMKSGMPDDLDLVFWDYYHTDSSVYEKKIEQHRELGHEPWVAGGVWTWNRLFTALPFTIKASRACLEACKKTGVRNVFLTMWGDDGNEYDFYSAMPGLVYFSEMALGAEAPSDATLREKFLGIFGGNWDDWIYASRMDTLIDVPEDDKTHFPPNMTKWLLWQDTAYSFFSPQCKYYQMESYYYDMHQNLSKASSHDLDMYPFNSRLGFASLLCHVLSIKTELRQHALQFYQQNDFASMHKLVEGSLKQLRALVDQLWKYHRDKVWLSVFKPFGMEIIEGRYGALRTRLESLEDRLGDWMAGRGKVEEFEQEARVIYEGAGSALVVDYQRAYTPARCLGMG